MRFQHKQAFLSLPYVKIYFSRDKRDRKFGLGKEVAEMVLCGWIVVCLFLRQDPGDAAARTPGPSLLPACPESALLRIIFRVTHVDDGARKHSEPLRFMRPRFI